jgi:DNA-binding transcriptional MerR regulator
MVLQLAGDDERLLQQHLLENSSGPLNAYLAGLDLEKEGITTTEELLRHLERVAQEQGFTMEDVRAALSAAMGHPLEVERLHAELLAQSEGEMLEILQGIDPKRDGIYTVEELISAIRQALMERGYSDREIRKILREMFPDHSAYIRSLTGKGGRAGGSAGIPVAVTAGIILAGGLLLWLILFWLRRRKKEE